METTVKTAGKKTVSQLASMPVDSVNRTIQYLDGLGRPIQTVQWQASPSKRDIVQLMIYDEFGREAIKYLPYTEEISNDGSFKTSALANQNSFYNADSWDANVPKTLFPFGKTVFEASPLNRVLEQGASGAPWQPYSSGITNSGHTIKTDNVFNTTNEVLLWKITSTGASASESYLPNRLYKTIRKDENWISGGGGTVEEFKDTEGKLILRRVWETDSISQCTYFVFDDSNNLKYVIPSAVEVSAFSETDATFMEYIYGYHHDGRKRVIEKKIPGKGWEHIVYNKLDQIVLSQDSIQRANSKWSFIKYDALGRMILTGIVSNSSTRGSWQASIDSQGSLWENRDNSNLSLTNTGYTNNILPNSGISQYHIISYYDDYGFYGNSFGLPVFPQVSSERTKGLLTGIKKNVLGTTINLLSVNYYNEEGRIIQSKEVNYLGGTDVTDNSYNFSGELKAKTRINVANGVTTTISNTFKYDHMKRKISTTENINNQGKIVLSKLFYNEIGQLKEKRLHSIDSGATFLQNTKYAYNERGWIKGITSPEFNFRLGYDTTATPQYTGNISTQLWGSGFGNKFIYIYDKVNRLTSAVSTGIVMSEVLNYDKMGNIIQLSRDGGATATYAYIGNQLNKINDGPLATGTYEYDANGNVKTDGRIGITFTYNELDLPVTAMKSGLNLSFNYDGDGQKLRKTNNTTGIIIDYNKGVQYYNGVIDFVQTEEGAAKNNGSGVYLYNYNLTDHLGNVRYTFDVTTAGVMRRQQEDNYYAFGLRKSHGTITTNNNQYLYNGKEIQQELGLTGDDGQYDYGARLYDPIVGRWNVIDSKAEKFNSLSPYNYVLNNPLKFIDPDGEDVILSKMFSQGAFGKVFSDLRSNNSAFQGAIKKYENNKNFNLTLSINDKKVKNAGAYGLTEYPNKGRNPQVPKSLEVNSYFMTNLDAASDGSYKLTTLAQVLTVAHEAVHEKIALTAVNEDGTHNEYNKQREVLSNILKEYSSDNKLDLTEDQITALSYAGQQDSKDFKKYITDLSKKNGTSYDKEKDKYNTTVSNLMYEKK